MEDGQKGVKLSLEVFVFNKNMAALRGGWSEGGEIEFGGLWRHWVEDDQKGVKLSLGVHEHAPGRTPSVLQESININPDCNVAHLLYVCPVHASGSSRVPNRRIRREPLQIFDNSLYQEELVESDRFTIAFGTGNHWMGCGLCGFWHSRPQNTDNPSGIPRDRRQNTPLGHESRYRHRELGRSDSGHAATDTPYHREIFPNPISHRRALSFDPESCEPSSRSTSVPLNSMFIVPLSLGRHSIYLAFTPLHELQILITVSLSFQLFRSKTPNLPPFKMRVKAAHDTPQLGWL
ncbi:hypothetical protein FB451DRAFT_1194700 [Mycena latifolia]|nr:hypothetical protein FB451DRAFT_1194700 [Mycena latifolia]